MSTGIHGASQVTLVGKTPPVQQTKERWVWSWESHLDPSSIGAWQPTPVFLPGESGGQGSLAGYSPLGHQESDTTEAT